MESQNIELRAGIQFFTKERANAKEIYRRMVGVYGDCSPNYTTVAKWVKAVNRISNALAFVTRLLIG